ncbi:RHS repeat protein [Bacillus sp. BGMRC 2118]|nr:RHS repeat protein [Bacillus sp. BGMRC 2118]
MLLGKVQRNILNYDIIPDIGENPDKKPRTRIELKSKRTRNSTRYLNSDGSFTEEIFELPQFYNDIEDKKWKSINNNLVKSSKISNKYMNIGNDFKTLFAEFSDSNNLFSVQKQGYQIDFILTGANKVNGIVNGNEIIYHEILSQIDVSYLVMNNMIKESLILKAIPKETKFTFEIRLPSVLKTRQEPNGSISILSPHNETIWNIDKPFMFDSKGVVSNNVYYNFRKQGNQNFIDLILDPSYINNPDISYPVIVDPTLQSLQLISDTFISNRYPQSSYSNLINMFTGTTPSYGITRSLIKVKLPPLPNNSKILKASFEAYQINSSGQNNTIDLYRINSPWDNTVSWNTQPVISNFIESSKTASSSGQYWEWDITKLSQDWYSGLQPNYGIMLKNRDESISPYGYFGSSENQSTYKPRMTISYIIDPVGILDDWTLTEEGINPFNGNITFQEPDIAISSRGVPLTVERVYNSRNSIEKGIFGYGWSSNLEVKLTFAASGPVVYTDGRGGKYYFGESSEGGYIPNSDSFLSLEKQEDGTFKLTEEDKKTNMIFNKDGSISKISDQNNNLTIFLYDTSGKLKTVQDASNRALNINFGNNGFVSMITINNRVYKYSQDSLGSLVSFTNAKNVVTSFEYDPTGKLVSRVDSRNIKTSISYDLSGKVSKVHRPLLIRGNTGEISVTYMYDNINNICTRILNNQRKEYHFNPLGSITQIVEYIQEHNSSRITKVNYNDNNEVVQLQDAKNQYYLYEYDEKGNLISEKLPENQQAYYSFDNENNLIKEQDYNRNLELYDYDENNNETESIDPYVQSVSKRYDSFGNILYQTNPMSVSDNILPNSSFEYGSNWPEYWQQRIQSGYNSQFSWATVSKFGKRSISISNPTGWAIVYQLINYVEQDSYVFSGYVKTVDTKGKAYLKIEFFDSSNVWLGQRNSYGLTGTHDWTRLQTVISNVPAGTVTIRVSAALDAGTGTAYFDSLQLEIGNVVSSYNLIENSSFETYLSSSEKIPQKWVTSGNFTSDDGRYETISNTDTRVYIGNSSFKLTGEKGKNKYLSQRSLLTGDSNTKLTLSGWSYQEGADPDGGYYLLQSVVNYTDGTVGRFGNDFSKTSFGWQHISVKIEPIKEFQSIDVYLYYYNQTGVAWFDGLRLEVEPTHTFYYYDEGKNYVTQIVNPIGASQYYTYDFFGNVTSFSDGIGNNTIKTYNEENEIISLKNPGGFLTSYSYDGEGNLLEVTDAKGNKKRFEYNQINELATSTNALNQITIFEYDEYGNMVEMRNPDGSIISNSYDSLNRLIAVSFNNVNRVSLGYDNNDNLTKVTESDGSTTTFTYNLNNLLISEVTGVNLTKYVYDANGNITSLTVQGGSQKNIIYNKLNLIRSILINNSIVANFIYNESGRILSIYFTNGTYSSYEYNGANQLTRLTNYNVNGLVMDSFEYNYSNNGNIINVKTLKGTIYYKYNQSNQLINETLLDGTNISYEYDQVGNRTNKTVISPLTTKITTYTYNQANQLMSKNNQNYKYDFNGNLIDNNKYLFAYNPINKLTEVKSKVTGGIITSFTYDYKGRRKTKYTENGTVIFHYDQNDNVIYETDPNGKVLIEYIWDKNNRPLVLIKNGVMYFYHINSHGDVIALSDQSGNIVATYQYDAWGNILSQTGVLASVNPYRFASYRYDEDINLYYLLARYYDSEDGIFTSQDNHFGELDRPLSQNGYSYAENNPVAYVDPSGNVIQAVLLVALRGAIEGAILGALVYYLELVAKFGFKGARSKFKQKELLKAAGLGFAAGAIGLGVPTYLMKVLGITSKVTKSFILAHFAVPAYAVTKVGSYSGKGLLLDVTIGSLPGQLGNIVSGLVPFISSMVNKRENKKKFFRNYDSVKVRVYT